MTTTDRARREPAGRAWFESAEQALYRPVAAAWLCVFRVLFGLTLSVSMLRFIAYGWITPQFGAPGFHFKYWGTAWVPALPEPWLLALFWGLAALALALALGFLFRWTAGAFVLGFTYLQLIDATNYLNHYYLAVLLGLLLWLSPAARFGSVDAALSRWRRRAQAGPRAAPVHAAAWLYLFRFQIGVVYFFAGIGKLQRDWLLSGQPLGIWLASHSDLPLLGPWLGTDVVTLGMSWAGFVFDTTIPLWLSLGRTRGVAFAILVVFHGVTGALFPIGMFPVIMIVSALVFFPPDWPRRGWGWLTGRAPIAPAVLERAGALPRTPRRHALTCLAVAYCLLQVALPLRFLAYGGNVSWHEQGMRWSWRVMVREKNGSVAFRVHSPRLNRSWEVAPARYLSRLQEREMGGQPDLILQLAHHVRDDFVRRGLGPVHVYVDAWVSLNGRRAARLIDPDVDLAGVAAGLGDAAWILPAPEAAPPTRREKS